MRETRGADYTRAVTTPREWFRIGDAARAVGVSPEVIRHWHTEFAAYLWCRRSKGGQRWYGPEQIATLRTIRELLHVELYTTEGAKRQLRLARERTGQVA